MGSGAPRLGSEDAHSENEDVLEAVETSPPARLTHWAPEYLVLQFQGFRGPVAQW
jgi:hypothetical protein